MVTILKKQIVLASFQESDYFGNSFWKSATQYTADYGLLNQNIQKLI